MLHIFIGGDYGNKCGFNQGKEQYRTTLHIARCNFKKRSSGLPIGLSKSHRLVRGGVSPRSITQRQLYWMEEMHFSSSETERSRARAYPHIFSHIGVS